MCLCWWRYLLLLRAKTGRESPPSYSLRIYVPIARIYLGIDCSPSKTLQRSSVTVYCTGIKRISLLFFLLYIHAISLLFSFSPFVFLALSLSLFLPAGSNVSLVRFAIYRFQPFNWLFNIAACSNRVRNTVIDAYSRRSLYTRNLNRIRITVCAYWRFNRPLFAVDYTRDACTCSCANTTNDGLYDTNCSSGVSCKACKEIPNGIRELNYYYY